MIKKALLSLAISVALLACICGCGSSQNEANSSQSSFPQKSTRTVNSPNQGNSSTSQNASGSNSNQSDPAEDENLIATLYADSYVSDGGDVPRDEQVKQYEYGYSGRLYPDILAEGLTNLTGLNFAINSSESYKDGILVDWAANSTLVAGLDDREQKQDFFFYDADSLSWFMMNSMAMTIQKNFEVENVYFSMDGGKDLSLPRLSNSTNIFPKDVPYMGSAFYIAHQDVKGDVNENTNANNKGSSASNNEPEWWGTYKTNTTSELTITNYDGNSLMFSLTSSDVQSGSVELSGTAPVDGNKAEYMDLIFELRGNEIEITLPNVRDDSGDRMPFVGVYKRQ